MLFFFVGGGLVGGGKAVEKVGLFCAGGGVGDERGRERGKERGRGVDILGGWVVSRTQYASLVSAIRRLFHLIWRWRGVFSTRGGRGKLLTLSLSLSGIVYLF